LKRYFLTKDDNLFDLQYSVIFYSEINERILVGFLQYQKKTFLSEEQTLMKTKYFWNINQAKYVNGKKCAISICFLIVCDFIYFLKRLINFKKKLFFILYPIYKLIVSLQASSRGLVVKAEDSWPWGPGFKPPLWRSFFRHHSFGSKLGTKIVENSNLALLRVL
jgi:hypothetical protein